MIRWVYVHVQGNFVKPLSVRYGLLTQSELTRIEQLNEAGDSDELGVTAKREVLTWCLQDITTDMRKQKVAGQDIAPSPVALLQIISDVKRLRNKSEGLFDLAQQVSSNLCSTAARTV